MPKTPLNIFFENFICEKYLFWKNFRFLGPFFGGGDYSGGGNFLKLFSLFERLLLQLQTLQVSEGVLGQKYFLNWPWSQKNLMSSWGGRWCRCSPSASSTCFMLSGQGPPLLHRLYFSLHTHLNPLNNISLQLKKKFSPHKWLNLFFSSKKWAH